MANNWQREFTFLTPPPPHTHKTAMSRRTLGGSGLDLGCSFLSGFFSSAFRLLVLQEEYKDCNHDVFILRWAVKRKTSKLFIYYLLSVHLCVVCDDVPVLEEGFSGDLLDDLLEGLSGVLEDFSAGLVAGSFVAALWKQPTCTCLAIQLSSCCVETFNKQTLCPTKFTKALTDVELLCFVRAAQAWFCRLGNKTREVCEKAAQTPSGQEGQRCNTAHEAALRAVRPKDTFWKEILGGKKQINQHA